MSDDDRTSTESRHIPLLELTDHQPWQADVALAHQIALAPDADVDSCPRCDEITTIAGQLDEQMAKLDRLAAPFAQLERTMRLFQEELRVIRKEQARLARFYKDQMLIHLRCACCSKLIGAGHFSREIREPFGPELVCPSCHRLLKATHTTAKDQRQLDALKEAEDAEQEAAFAEAGA